MKKAPAPSWPGRRSGHPHDDLLAAYLLVDIQVSAQWAEELCERARMVARGVERKWERVGNAYQLTLTPGEASIETLDEPGGGPPVRIPLARFRAAADAWREQIAVAE